MSATRVGTCAISPLEHGDGAICYSQSRRHMGKAIQTAVNQGIQKAFVSSSIKIIGTTVFSPAASKLIDLAYGYVIGV